MSTPLFHATCLAAVEDEVGWVVGLADHELDTRQYLQFQRGHVSDAQDQALGHDTYYVERDDQSNSCYGGIESIDLGANAITLRLGDVGSQSLSLDKNVLITFDADEQTLDRFRRGLIAVFAGTDLIHDCTID
jgi:hypothetical protein